MSWICITLVKPSTCCVYHLFPLTHTSAPNLSISLFASVSLCLCCIPVRIRVPWVLQQNVEALWRCWFAPVFFCDLCAWYSDSHWTENSTIWLSCWQAHSSDLLIPCYYPGWGLSEQSLNFYVLVCSYLTLLSGIITSISSQLLHVICSPWNLTLSLFPLEQVFIFSCQLSSATCSILLFIC